MITCDDIKSFLNTHYYYMDTFSKLSNNQKITDQTEAYDFDKIKEMVYKECKSSDALYIKNNLNLIEFKTGFDMPDFGNDKLKKENLKLKVRVKAYESLHLLQTAIINKVGDGILEPSIKTIFCAVVDSNEPIAGEDIIQDILSEASYNIESSNLKTEIENVMRIYRKETNEHEKLFYDEAFVLYDYEFDENVKLFK